MWWVAAEIVCLRVRVVDDEVGVRADGDRALLRVHPEQLGRRRRDDLDPALLRDPAADDAAVVEQVDAVLDAGQAVGDLAEVAAPELLLAVEVERAVVGRDELEVVLDEPGPQVVPVVLRSGAAASRRTSRPRTRCRGRRATGRGTAGTSRRRPCCRAPARRAPLRARRAPRGGRCRPGRRRPRPGG